MTMRKMTKDKLAQRLERWNARSTNMRERMMSGESRALTRETKDTRYMASFAE